MGLRIDTTHFDASVRGNSGTGLGLMIHDCKGEVLVAAIKFSESELCPKEAKALPFRWTTITTTELYIRGAIFESDFLQLCQAWWKTAKGKRSFFHSLVKNQTKC